MAELHYEDGPVRLYRGDCRDVMALLPDASVDAIVTDPPYELGFMGKGWDSSGIAYDPEVWAHALRVLKPGGHALVFGGTRTWHRVAVAVEDAGFEIRDSLAWLYGSGFPKSMDVSKAIDAAAGAVREERIIEGVTNPAQHMRSKAFAQQADPTRQAATTSEPVTDEAKAWDGWGTALKPAFEPVVIARKPLEGTVAANVLAHGTGAFNIDASRIPTGDKLGGGAESSTVKKAVEGRNRPWMDDADAQERHAATVRENVKKAEQLGRFPSNVILDESQAAALDAQSGASTSRQGKPRSAAAGDGWGMTATGSEHDDTGGASRFFYVAKAGKSERPVVDGHQHATVKPLALMRYLVRLVTPPPVGWCSNPSPGRVPLSRRPSSRAST